MVLRLSIRSNRTNGEHHLRPEKKSCRSEKWISLVGLRNVLLCIFCGWGIVHSLSIGSNRSNGEWHSRSEKKSCRSEKWISLVGLRNIQENVLWLDQWCLGLSIRTNRSNGEHYSRPEKKCCRSEKWISLVGWEIYCFAYFVAEVFFTVCRSVRIVRMENGIYDPRKRVVDPRNVQENVLWLDQWCLGVVDPYESFEWRTLLTTQEKVLSIRKMNLISGT